MLHSLCFRLHMIQRCEFPFTPFRRASHRAEDILLQRLYLRSRVRQVLSLLKLDFEAVLRNVLAWFLQALAGGIFEYGPEIGDAEDYGGAAEGGK